MYGLWWLPFSLPLSLYVQYEYPGDNDEEGNPTTRQGKISDAFPNPYPNDEAAKFANNGQKSKMKSK